MVGVMHREGENVTTAYTKKKKESITCNLCVLCLSLVHFVVGRDNCKTRPKEWPR
jgi:hypothetical protein